jgi:hypothetical protein
MKCQIVYSLSYQELTCVGGSEFVLSKGFTRSVLQSEFRDATTE